ncbi:MAG TPA: polysaccharide pyruvyl transferase family protein, partial [Chloroflexia bacterium]|nr:polysaccharide pyruvyl transferase family protein [Chloroflexia bacterium]
VALARLLGLKVIGWGLGVEPLWTSLGKAQARYIVSSSTYFSVRDTVSLNILRAAGVETGNVKVTADPAFLIKPKSITENRDILRPRVTFCVRHLSDNHPGINLHYLLPVSVRRRLRVGWRPPVERRQRFMDALARGVALCTGEFGAEVKLLPLWPGRDDDVLDEVKRAAIRLGAREDRVGIAKTGTLPSEVAAYVGTADMLVSMRLHALIFGAGQGVPLLALSYARKVRGLMRMLGKERWVVEVETRTPPPEEIEMKLRILWQDRVAEGKSVKSAAEAAYVRAEVDADAIAGLLK